MGGLGHPRPLKADQPLGAARTMLMALAIAIFVTSFMLVPVTLPQLGFR